MKEIRAFFFEAFHVFLTQERDNIINGVAERNLCARLAMTLEFVKKRHGFDAYEADPECDRRIGARYKTIVGRRGRIVSDIVVHGRGKLGALDNLIAIEMKKSGQPYKAQKDRNRLKAMTAAAPGASILEAKDVCGYQLGIFIEFDVKQRRFRVEEFCAGERISVQDGGF